jgi:TetR/AcrR family transcriptional regulator
VELADMALSAEDLLARLIRNYYEFHATHPRHVRLLMWENLRQGRAAKDLRIGSIKTPIIEALRIALARGKAEGRFRPDVDEKQLLISCMGLSFFYFSNRHTISQALGVDLAAPGAVERRIQHDVRLLLEGIRTERAAIRKPRRKGQNATVASDQYVLPADAVSRNGE